MFHQGAVMRVTQSSCIVQIPLTSPPVFGTNEFGNLHAWNPKCVDAFMDFCLCSDYGHGCANKSLHFVFICPNLNQNNTVFRVGRGHLKVCKMQVTPPF